MKKWNALYKLIGLAMCLFVSTAQAQTAIDTYGQLSVSGTKIVSSNGSPVQLQGMSLFWSNWQGSYYKKSTVEWLRDDWCINIIRAAMAVDVDNSGYMHNKAAELKKVEDVIDAAIDLGIYVLVDFHSHHASDAAEELVALEFFDHISSKYGDYPNIIYEPFNEPLQVSWSNVVKPYHEKLIAAIRKNDANNIIVLGTPSWDQKVDEASDDPVEGDNIAYALHYYASTHKQSLRNTAQYAINKGLCLFVTEYGICEANGDGVIDEVEAGLWWDFLDANDISHCNWSISDKDEAASAIQTNTSSQGNWIESDLREGGVIVRNMLKDNCPDYGPEATGKRVRIPTKIEAEVFTYMKGVQKESTTDVGGGEKITELEVDDILEYEITAPVTGYYDVQYRVSSTTSSGFKVFIDSVETQSQSINSTGSLETWVTIEDSIAITEGDHTIRIVSTGTGWNINFIEFIKTGIPDCNGVIDGDARIDDCDVCVGGNTNVVANSTCEQDCNNEWNGAAAIDECDVCAGGTTGIEPGEVCSGYCEVGVSATGAYDDYKLQAYPGNSLGTILPVGEDDLAGDGNPLFKATFERFSEDSNMTLTITQGEGQYTPFSYTFGNGNTLDLSDEANLEIDLENISPYDVKIDFSLEDIYGVRAYVSRDAVNDDFGNAWQYEFSKYLDAGNSGKYVLDFNGAVNADYNSSTYTSTMDFSQIARVQITIRNKAQTLLDLMN